MKRNLLALLLTTALTAPLAAQDRPTPRAVHTTTIPANAPTAAPQPVSTPAPAAAPSAMLARADGARIVPDRFLRAWDPVTIFFDADSGPTAGGPEDRPERFATLTPPTVGEWRWIGARALQFRPASPWRPLQRVEIKSKDSSARLVTLLPAPESTNPAEGADPVSDLDQIALTFAEPVDAAALARLVTVELRKAPGVSPEGGQILGARDFEIRPLERAKKDDKPTYVVRFKSPVPDGRVAVLRLKLSDEPGLDDPIFEMRARTAQPFTVSDADCGKGFSSNRRDDVLQCASLGQDTDAQGDDDSDRTAPAYAPAPKRRISLGFTADPQDIDILKAREALRITPPVDDLALEQNGSTLRLTARFLSDRVYEIALKQGALVDDRKRPLAEDYAQKFAFTADAPSIVWDAGQGIVERFGPQFLPMRGRGYDRADVRIHRIDPLSRDFWPFPGDGVQTADSDEPALPGKAPKAWTENDDAAADAIADRIKNLGSPAVSELVTLPIRRGGVDAKFGLDLKKQFAQIAGADQPGAYLVGLRATDGAKRNWLRVQVTDLALAAVEEVKAVRFVVTSLSTASPVEGATVRLEGLKDDRFVTLMQGRTDANGQFAWPLDKRADAEIRRIVVTKGLDTLVLSPDEAPSQYAQENWTKPEDAWLGWTTAPDEDRKPLTRTLCHVFTERPIYRPEEPVHFKGYVRSYVGGRIMLTKAGGTLVIAGPNNQEWRAPVKPDAAGGFYYKFDAATPATGDYTARFEPDGYKPKPKADDQNKDAGNKDDKAQGGDDDAGADEQQTQAEGPQPCGETAFKKEAYKLPTFEVVLNAPQTVPLDGEFSVDLLARYFAGGLVAERPVKWRAAQFPYLWTPPGREGFLFSTDSRFSGDQKFKSSPVLERDGRTDAGGASRMSFDTTIEPTAQPRRYSIEATVTGDDDAEVRNVVNIIATPPFALGVKTPRYVEKPGAIAPEIVAVDGKGAPVEGLDMTVRFIRRNWVSTLQASDFAQGAAKYVTQTIDETLVERKITSAKDVQKLSFEAKEAGVYLVQLEAYDKIGRRQQVSVDFFVGGQTPVTWAKAPAQTATVTSDKDSYAPGETATLVVQSPFQTARALAIVEEPSGQFRYDWVDVANGYARYPLTLAKEEMPKLAVHFLIMRGRLPDTAPNSSAPFDQGKPVTIAATKWVNVTPVRNIVTAKLEYPAKARPGQEVEVALRLSDETGAPLAGEATFWMVDQAVLSLAKERPLDPLPSFIVEWLSTMAARDTRNMAFGVLPLEEIPGGDQGLDEWGAETNISVRKNFTPVPIYLPGVKVGPDGVAKIRVKLPDTLTVFKLRAKAVSGPDRFGYATGEMLIRQEIVAQPALPRFARPGDRFDAGLIARVVEGPGGGGHASFAAQGLTLDGAVAPAFAWNDKPARLEVSALAGETKAGADSAKLRFAVTRDADQARDAVEIDLPLKPDRTPARRYDIVEIPAGGSATLAAAPSDARPGSFRRTLAIAADPAIVKLVAGLDTLIEYPYGCTEQRISLASAGVALKAFTPIMTATGLDQRIGLDVRNTQAAIDQAIDADGLVAFWPRAKGNVSLTAWAYSFLVAAKRAGEPIDDKLADRLANVLKMSLRSDYPRLMSGEELRERVEALVALADGGKADEGYVAELARRADFMPNVSVAEMASAATRAPNADKRVVASLLDSMWSRVRIVSRNGEPAYGGQAADGGDPRILPSETRSLAEMTRAVALGAPDDPRFPVLRDGLMRLGEGDGWGSTNATSAAIRALAAAWRRPAQPIALKLAQGAAQQTLTLDANTPVVRTASEDTGATTISNAGKDAVVVLVDTRWEPAQSGAKAQAYSNGFAISRTLARIAASAPPEKLAPDANGALQARIGDVVEETVDVVNPENRTFVAISLPLAAGFEPLNPDLATSPAEARPSAPPTLQPTSVSFGDDRVFYAYDALPKGNYRFQFRVRAQTAGVFTQPPGTVETMYQKGLQGASAGAQIVIAR
ncbi:MAG: alpha-2-macroglobulin [Hyphomicrobiales bacterium]|nr:alpha-2-macroglobulin [Hyphomicrobiales bacterium]